MDRQLIILLVGALLVHTHAAEYRFIGRRTSPANDIDCGQKDYEGKKQSFCKICDGVAAVADACDSNPSCQGFDMEGSYCGYLKKAAGRGKTAYTEGFSHYCKIGAGTSCEGDYIVQRRADVSGKDVQCQGKDYQGKAVPYCQVQGNLNDVAAACSANPNCKAFTTTSSGGGFLKTAAGPTSYAEGIITYKKA